MRNSSRDVGWIRDRSTFLVGALLALLGLFACSHDRRSAPPTVRSPPSASLDATAPPAPEAAPPAPPEPPVAHRARLSKHVELYVPPWFEAKNGGYDLIVHFHGLGRYQEANIEALRMNVAVVSVNLGAGTDPYERAFRDPGAFDRLLGDAEAEIQRSGRAAGASVRRLALSAWSAGFSSIARAMTEELARRVDAVLLADGFFASFTQPKKRIVNARAITKFADFAEAAKRNEKLFAITHTTIPTGPYPSVQECVAKLLEMTATRKTPSRATGPRKMREIYKVDRGSFHVHGYRGTRASDHIRQLHAMGETLYPYLKERWDRQDAEAAAAAPMASAAPASSAPPQPAPPSSAAPGAAGGAGR